MKRAKKARRVEEKAVYVLLREGKIALRQRPENGLLASLWEFPNVEGAVEEARAGYALAEWGLTALEWRERLTAKHIFTHVEWHMTGYVLEVTGEGTEEFLWADQTGLESHAVPSAFGKFYEAALEALAKEE